MQTVAVAEHLGVGHPMVEHLEAGHTMEAQLEAMEERLVGP
jgi:hypothetical protein